MDDSRLNVVHLLDCLKVGGAERFVIDLAFLQREQGINAGIVHVGSDGDELNAEAVKFGIPLQIGRPDGFIVSRLVDLHSKIKNADVIHIHSWGIIRFLLFLLPFLAGKKIVYTRHGLNRLDNFRWKVMHQLIRPFVDYVTFVTEAGLNVFAENHAWNPAKLRVIENGVYIPGESSRVIGNPVNLGSVGRMVKLKGQAVLLKTVGAMIQGNEAGPDFKVHFYGDGPEEEELKKQGESLVRDGKVEFHGSVMDRDEIYNTMDILVVCSETEGLSLVIMEAMARGICVVATNVGGNPSLIKDQETGCLYEYGDAQRLQEILANLLHEPALIRQLGEAGKQFIVSRYSLEKTNQMYLDCYH